jgi:hypothetical protein
MNMNNDTKWFWAISGQSGQLYVQNGNENNNSARDIIDTIERRGDVRKLKAKSVKVERYGPFTNQWYEIHNDHLMAIYNEIEAEIKKIRARKGVKIIEV